MVEIAVTAFQFYEHSIDGLMTEPSRINPITLATRSPDQGFFLLVHGAIVRKMTPLRATGRSKSPTNKGNIMKNLLMLVLVTLAVGCGGAAMDQEEVQTETLGTQESALLVCGSTCPTGYYVAQRNCDISCGSCSTTWNQVVCNPIPTSGTINPCGSTCPTGFVSQGLTCNSTCWTCFAPNFTNSVSCRK